MNKKIKLIVGVMVLLGLVAVVFGYMMLGSIVKSGVEQVGPMVTKVPVKVGGATVSILSGSGSLHGFVLGNPEGFKTEHAMKVGKLGVSISPGSVLKEKVVVRSVRVEGPEIIFEQGMKGNNLSKILENVKSVAGTSAPGTNQAAAGPGKKLQVDEFVVSGGKITVGATMLGGKGATLALPEIRLANLGQGPEGITPAELVEMALGAVVKGTLQAVADGAGELAKHGVDALKNVENDGGKSLEKVGTGIGDLFKKK